MARCLSNDAIFFLYIFLSHQWKFRLHCTSQVWEWERRNRIIKSETNSVIGFSMIKLMTFMMLPLSASWWSYNFPFPSSVFQLNFLSLAAIYFSPFLLMQRVWLLVGATWPLISILYGPGKQYMAMAIIVHSLLYDFLLFNSLHFFGLQTEFLALNAPQGKCMMKVPSVLLLPLSVA